MIWDAVLSLEKGVGSTTLELKMSLIRPLTPETAHINAEGRRDQPKRTAQGNITNSKGGLLVHAAATCLFF